MKIGFDKVYCISYCRNIEKQKNIRKVMKYLGIDFTFIYGADYSNLNILKHPDFRIVSSNDINIENYFKNKRWQYYTHYVGASYDHYTAVIHAYESGFNSVLIIEDDATFINDVDYIEHTLNNYPKDADIVKFGCHFIDKNYFENSNINLNVPNQFIKNRRLDGCQLYGICNRKSLKKYIEVQQKGLICCDWMFNNLYFENIYQLIYPLVIDKELYIKFNHINEYKKYNLLEHI